MPFVATWMDVEIAVPSEVSQTKKDKYHMIWLICGILKKKGTNELTHKTEIKLQIQETNLWLPGGNGGSRDKLEDQD